MAKLKITLADGATLEVEGRRFSHHVAGDRFWFFLHKTIGGHGLTVTHCESGKRVLEVPHYTLAACRGDAQAAGRLALDKLIEKVGEQRVRSVLAGA